MKTTSATGAVSQHRKIGHEDGDHGLIRHFVDVVRRDAKDDVLASGHVSLESHLMGFAAEEARVTGALFDMAAYRARLEEEVEAAGLAWGPVSSG